ncbi:hypothetical protein IWX65_003357 [Arthrobacter sp. CAN_A214]|uniref:hypothetical protein n=1 Tax=Arthrobacter sp. CAN_A214 TaxID=2787720 RepID=UPI0018C94744
MATFVSEPAHAYTHHLADLQHVRETLMTTVLEARSACESGTDQQGLQLLLSAAVKDVEDVDQMLHMLRTTASEPESEPGAPAAPT